MFVPSLPCLSLYLPKEEVDEYVKLAPEEQQKRLKSIVKKIDLDSDGFLTESKDVLHTQLTNNSGHKHLGRVAVGGPLLTLHHIRGTWRGYKGSSEEDLHLKIFIFVY